MITGRHAPIASAVSISGSPPGMPTSMRDVATANFSFSSHRDRRPDHHG